MTAREPPPRHTCTAAHAAPGRWAISRFRLGGTAGVCTFRLVIGFEVSPGELRTAGAAGGAVADGVRGVDLAAPARGLGAALPGGAVAAAAGEVERVWSGAVTSLAAGMGRHATAMAAAADGYAGADAAAVAALRAPAPIAAG